MEIRNLITFKKIVELGSFSKAAEALSYTQSTVTMQMKQLESELNVKLFDRIGRTSCVNSEGLRFLKYANSILSETSNALNDFQSSKGPSGELRIGITDSLCMAYLPSLISEYHTKCSNVSTIIKIGAFDELSNMLNNGNIDIMWVFSTRISMPQWIQAYIKEDHITPICSTASSLASMNSVSLHDITIMNTPLILTEANCTYRSSFINAMTSAGYTPNIFLEIGSTEIIKKFVAANLGIGVLPHYTCQDEIESGKLLPLCIKDYDTLMYSQIFYHKNKWLSPAMNEFINLVQLNNSSKELL